VSGEAAMQIKLDAANARIAELERELAELRAKPAPPTDVAAAAPQRPTVVVVEQVRDDGTALALKRIAAKHLRPGLSPEEVVRALGEPKEKRRDGARDVYVYKRADAGRQNHGTFTPGPRYTLTLSFDTSGKLETIDAIDR
jgi:hypothetical protein